MLNLHSHTLVVKFCTSRGEGRRGWEGRVKKGVEMKHMIILE